MYGKMRAWPVLLFKTRWWKKGGELLQWRGHVACCVVATARAALGTFMASFSCVRVQYIFSQPTKRATCAIFLFTSPFPTFSPFLFKCWHRCLSYKIVIMQPILLLFYCTNLNTLYYISNYDLSRKFRGFLVSCSSSFVGKYKWKE